MPTYSTHRGYGYFTPPPDTATDALWLGFDAPPDELRARFTSCAPRPADGLQVWLCTARTAPWTSFWPAIRTR